MTINLNLMLSTTRIQKYFPLSVFVFIDSLAVSASQDAGDHTLSRQNNLTFGIGLHEVDVRISLINTHRHTVLKKYRLKYLILTGNSQGQGKIPGNPKKTYRNVPTPPQNETEIQDRFATPKIGVKNPNPNPKVKSGVENCVQYMESIFEI